MKELFKGFRTGIGISLALFFAWSVAAFASAVWWALPNATTGASLSSGAWNDIVSHVNTLANALNVSSGNVGIGVAPTAKLDVNGDAVIRGSLTTTSNLNSIVYASNMPNDMSFPANGSVLGSTSAPMPVGTYFYQIYGCNGQNNFSGWALGSVAFASGSGEATVTNYFDNVNVGGGSCGYFLSGFIKVTTPNSTIQFRITNNYPGGSNADGNPSANSFYLHAWRIY